MAPNEIRLVGQGPQKLERGRFGGCGGSTRLQHRRQRPDDFPQLLHHKPRDLPAFNRVCDDEFDERKAIEIDALKKFIKNGTHFARPFHSDVLTPEEIRNEIERHEYEHSFSDKTYRP